MSTKSSVTSGRSSAAPTRQLTLWDSTSIIVGIIIGSTIYESTPLIAGQASNLAWLMAFWVIGGLLSLVGALCYAELANAYPKEGGDYVYLTEAFGRRTGFLFAWMQFWIIRPGSVGSLAYVFARYANELCPLPREYHPLVIHAVAATVILSCINLLGVMVGKWTQNVLTLVKFLGLVAIVVLGFALSPVDRPVQPHGDVQLDIAFAMIFIFYAYSGWNEMAYVGSEVRNPEKNILRALLLGTVAVAVLYIALNLTFVHVLGLEGLRASKAVAADVLSQSVGRWAGLTMSLLICISALGAINGMVFTGARIFYAMGTEHRLFAWLGRWNSLRDTPSRPLIIQAVVAIVLIIGFGMSERGFEELVILMGPAFWGFLVLVGAGLFVLRGRNRQRNQLYRVPLYPLLPLIFCLSSAFMCYQSVKYAWAMTPRGLVGSAVVLAIGLGLSFLEGAGRSES